MTDWNLSTHILGYFRHYRDKKIFDLFDDSDIGTEEFRFEINQLYSYNNYFIKTRFETLKVVINFNKSLPTYI